MTDPLTPEEATRLSGFTEYQKIGTTSISDRTWPAGTIYETPEGLHAEDEETRCAFDVQGGIYPIRESVFQAVYRPATARADTAALDVERLARALHVLKDARHPDLYYGLDAPPTSRRLAAAIAKAYREDTDG